MPSANPFAILFGKSPIKPMQEHMAVVADAAMLLKPFFEAVIAGDWAKAEEVQNNIHQLENDADKLKKQLRLHLPKSLFLPVPRSDLLELLSGQDKIANRAKDIAGIMLGRKMKLPAALGSQMLAFVDSAVATVAQSLKAINELDELLETGFAGRELSIVENMIGELDTLENRADEMEVTIRAALFALESEMPPVDVMFLYRVIDWVGDVADRAQKVGSRLELLLAR